MKMKTKNVIWRQSYWTISATVLLALLAGPGFEDTKRPLAEWAKQVVKSIYPIEKVGVIARSVTFPQVLNQGQAIIDAKYPNASILCMDVANYSGLVTGLIWSMDRQLVEEYGLHYSIDSASVAFFTCVDMFMAPQVANPDRVIAASREIEEKTPAVSMGDAKKAVVAQVEKIQEMIRFAQTVKSKQNE
jgi:hypothetical protein